MDGLPCADPRGKSLLCKHALAHTKLESPSKNSKGWPRPVIGHREVEVQWKGALLLVEETPLYFPKILREKVASFGPRDQCEPRLTGQEAKANGWRCVDRRKPFLISATGSVVTFLEALIFTCLMRSANLRPGVLAHTILPLDVHLKGQRCISHFCDDGRLIVKKMLA